MAKLRWAAIVFALISFLGLVDTAYLTLSHYRNFIPPCTLVNGCEKVLTSEYSTLAGVPISLLGLVNYLFLFLLALVFLDVQKAGTIKFAAKFSTFGFLASLAFVYLQIFVIRASCFYCLVSAAVSTLLFVAGLFILWQNSGLSTPYFDKQS